MTTLSSGVNLNISSGMQRSTVSAVFSDRGAARRAIGELRSSGLRADQISVAMCNYHEQQKLIAETGTHAAEGAVGVAMGGGFLRALLAMNIPEAEAQRQQSSFRNGSVLVAVRVFLGAAQAQSILDRNGGGVLTRVEQSQLN